ncbi:hypothetical protein GOB93_15435 [Acetobacter musti]|uniref:Uncharacterized protein n=1 Tax=Acetobacter musti TaxID=864732 RepID=A0ABX0JTB8_9PROT|nr:hypothetical protein [Acetobacter musti]NHN86023.1 hypothetical protein [Acetobacter musti]
MKLFQRISEDAAFLKKGGTQKLLLFQAFIMGCIFDSDQGKQSAGTKKYYATNMVWKFCF